MVESERDKESASVRREKGRDGGREASIQGGREGGRETSSC